MINEPLPLNAFEAELERILASKAIQSLFQPLVDVASQTVFGYEGLSRGPSDSPLHGAQLLFETAEKMGKTPVLESACLESTAERWSGYGMPGILFVNASPDKLMPSLRTKDRLKAMVAHYGLDCSQVVIELSERYPINRPAALLKSLRWLKQQGFKIAIDDLGAGYSGLKLWSDIRPDYVKIDRHFIRGINEDLVKKQFVRSLVELAGKLNCEIIAEGVETAEELEEVKRLNIHLIQGFLFGRPGPVPTANLEPLAMSTVLYPRSLSMSARELCVHVTPVTPDTTLHDAWFRFQHEPHLFSLPIVEQGTPLGLLHKWRMLETYSTPFGRSLFEKQPVTHLMNVDSLVVAADTSIDEVSQKLVAEDTHYLKQHFIVVAQDEYIGLGSSRRVLEEITQARIESARHANPLTSLPGNVLISRELTRWLEQSQSFTLVYFDINHFKPFNDILGFRMGDRMLVFLAGLLREHFHGKTGFIGHIGGDDFVVMDTSPDVLTPCLEIVQLFNEWARNAYDESTRERGFVTAVGREGTRGQFPLSSLAVGLVRVTADCPFSADQLADRAAEAKKQAKESAQGYACIDA